MHRPNRKARAVLPFCGASGCWFFPWPARVQGASAIAKLLRRHSSLGEEWEDEVHRLYSPGEFIVVPLRWPNRAPAGVAGWLFGRAVANLAFGYRHRANDSGATPDIGLAHHPPTHVFLTQERICRHKHELRTFWRNNDDAQTGTVTRSEVRSLGAAERAHRDDAPPSVGL